MPNKVFQNGVKSNYNSSKNLRNTLTSANGVSANNRYSSQNAKNNMHYDDDDEFQDEQLEEGEIG